MEALTKAQDALLDYLVAEHTATGEIPSYAEMGRAMGYTRQAARSHFKALERKGAVTITRAVNSK